MYKDIFTSQMGKTSYKLNYDVEMYNVHHIRLIIKGATYDIYLKTKTPKLTLFHSQKSEIQYRFI